MFKTLYFENLSCPLIRDCNSDVVVANWYWKEYCSAMKFKLLLRVTLVLVSYYPNKSGL